MKAGSLSVLALVLLATSCSKTPMTEDNDDWSVRQTLPLISANSLPPLKGKTLFNSDYGYLKYSPNKPVEPRQASYATDAEAVETAKAFFSEYFGPLPFRIRVNRIEHTVSGSAIPQSPDDVGYTIVFDTVYHGIVLADHGAVVYIRARSIESASITFINLKPIPKSEQKLIDRKQAISIWSQKIAEYSGKTNMRVETVELRYVWSPEDNLKPGVEEQVLRPNWFFGDGLYIDAFTGKIWRND